jgi:hypothetical protein
MFSGFRLVVTPPRTGRSVVALLCGCCGKFGNVGPLPRFAPSPGHREYFFPTVIIPGHSDETLRCSRTGCGVEPHWQVIWRNPKIHAEDRRKVWLSCLEHKDYFEAYLGQRGFPVHAEAVGDDRA